MAKKNQDALKDLEKLDVLEQTFIDMNNDKARVGINLLQEALFLKKVLTDLKQEVNNNGVVTDMCQGNYSIQRENPALKSYNVTLKSFQSVFKQMTDLIGNDIKSPEDEFDDFNK